MSFVEISSYQLIILALSVLVILTAGLFLYVFVFNNRAMLKHSLSQQAFQDYRDSRGSVHLELMTAAHDRLNVQLEAYNREISETRRALATIDTNEKNELTRVLHGHIVSTRLVEVNGIGPKLKKQIINRVYRNSLSDLRHAYLIDGVGATRQYEIDRWVDRYEQQTPHLLTQDFPRKNAIIQTYAEQRRGYKRTLDKLIVQAGTLTSQLGQLKPEIRQLQKVTMNDFVNAYQDRQADQQAVDHYQRGIFAEWEEVPNWFKSTVLAVQS